MAELLSVGLDVGTTTTQLIVSRLQAENRASSFAVPQMEITSRRVVYESPVHFTPINGDRVDGAAIRALVEGEYRAAGITPQTVDTGAIIVTGETSRKENAAAVAQALSEYAGDFVVATAGPDLESVLAAKGAGAADYSEKHRKTLLHIDIGGGTSNFARIEDGVITATWCLNVGGRLVRLDESGAITYVSPVLSGLSDLKVGEKPPVSALEALADTLVQALEMACGLRPETELLDSLTTHEGSPPKISPAEVISFSGGVADCIETQHPPLAFGDIGPILGKAIRRSRLCGGAYILGANTIRATVIGAGCHSARLSGSTVFMQNVKLPMKNLPMVKLSPHDPVPCLKEPAVLYFSGEISPDYETVSALAGRMAKNAPSPLIICLEADMAKALGVALALRLREHPIVCIDSVPIPPHSYLDLGAPVGPALPVVVKTLIFQKM